MPRDNDLYKYDADPTSHGSYILSKEVFKEKVTVCLR